GVLIRWLATCRCSSPGSSRLPSSRTHGNGFPGSSFPCLPLNWPSFPSDLPSGTRLADRIAVDDLRRRLTPAPVEDATSPNCDSGKNWFQPWTCEELGTLTFAYLIHVGCPGAVEGGLDVGKPAVAQCIVSLLAASM